MMKSNRLFWVVWAGFIAYAFLLAPPDRPDTVELIRNLSIGNWDEINPIIIALFNLMGIWPIAYACMVLIDGRSQKIPAWPFALVSFGVGAFALMPYLALRQPSSAFPGSKNALLKVVDSRILGLLLTLASAILVFYGLQGGDWGDFIAQWQNSRFIHVMSLDFCLLWLLFPALLGDDMARRGIDNPVAFWVISAIPLFGALIYLSWRKPLPEEKAAKLSGEPASG
jgi:hypothetical protein